MLQLAAPVDPERSAWHRARARLYLILSQEDLALQEASLSIQWAARLQQWDELEATLQFLRGLESEEAVSEDTPGDFGWLLEAAVRLTACLSAAQLAEETVRCAVELTDLAQLAWLQRLEGQWEAAAWHPVEAWPRFSHQAVERCWDCRETLFGAPEALGDSRSLLLSDLGTVVAVPVHWQGQVYGILYSEFHDSGHVTDSIRLLNYVAGVAAAAAHRLDLQEKARRALEEAEALNRLRREIFGRASLGLAVADAQGYLLEWNEAFARFWDGPLQPGLPVWQLFSGQESVQDQQLLASLEQQRTRLVVQRTTGHRRWLQVNDWRLAGQHKLVRTVLDLSSEEPGRWLGFGEEMRQQLAADLHDGPAQLSAALVLTEPGPASTGWMQRVRWRLQSLRSPWSEQRGAGEALQDRLGPRLGPDCRFQLDWDEDAPEVAQMVAYRCLLALAEEVAPALAFEASLLEGRLNCGWQGQPAPDLFLEWLRARLALLEAELHYDYQAGRGQLQIGLPV